MKKFNQYVKKGAAMYIVAVSLLATGCAKFESQDFHADKPQNVIEQEIIDGYDDLKTYVNRGPQPSFRLGTEVSLADIVDNTLLFRLALSNFDEVRVDTGFNHQRFILADGNTAFGAVQQLVDILSEKNLGAHGGHLIWHRKTQGQYLRDLVADIIIPGENGVDLVEDFESTPLGSSWPMYNTGSAVIIEDPRPAAEGSSGHVVNAKGSNPFIRISVDLPGGRKLGDYTHVIFDMSATGQTGVYGQGMRMAINSKPVTSYPGAATQGVPNDGRWGREKIRMALADLNLSSAEKELTSFDLSVGSATGSGDYYIDNIRMAYDIPGAIISKTDEEKREIFTGELQKFVGGIVDIGKSHIKSWSVLYQPLLDVAPYDLRSGAGIDPIPAEQFYWHDYFGPEYGVAAFNIARQHGNSDDKLFVTETNLLNPGKRQRLIDYVSFIDNNGATVDGIGVELPISINTSKQEIDDLFGDLAATGKLIKIAALDVGIGVTTPQATDALYKQQNEMYEYVISSYYQSVPATQRAGITFNSAADRVAASTWRANQPVGLWNSNYIRKSAYEAVVKALESQ